MALGLVNLNIEYYPDPTQGRPVFNGSIYIGIPDLDPLIEANRVTVQIRQEGNPDLPILPSGQPLLTGGGGVVLYNGSPAQILYGGNYSLKVLNNLGVQVYYIPNAFAEVVGNTTEAIVVTDKTEANTLTPVEGKKVFITSADGGSFTMRTGLPIGTLNDDGGSFIGSKFTNGDGSEGLERDEVKHFDVVWFGAVGNTSVVGTPPIVDDTAAINLTINAARSTDKNVVIPAGNYLVTDTITIYSGINLVGSNMGGVSNGFAKRVGSTEITFNPAVPTDLFVTVQETPPSSHDQFSSITGIRMVGGASGGNANIGISLDKLIYCAFRNLTISGFNTGIYCKGTINNRFEQVYIDTCSLSCVLIDSTSTTDVFDQCTFFGSTTGVIINNSISIRFSNCIWEQCDDYGLIMNSRCENIMVFGGYCEDVPFANTAPDNAMFNVGNSGGVAVIGNLLTVVGGVYSGNNTGNQGSFLDADFSDGIFFSDVSHSRYVTIYKTGTNTKDRSITLNGTRGISWTTFASDFNKISGTFDPRTTDVSTGPEVRSKNAAFDQIESFTSGGSVSIVSPVVFSIPSVDWTSTVAPVANCSVPAFNYSKFIQIGDYVYCEVRGTVTVTASSTETSFSFTLPVDANSNTSAASGSIVTNWGGYGSGVFVNLTGTNPTQQLAVIPAGMVNATGAQTFTFGCYYLTV